MFRKKLHGAREGSICIYGMTWKSTSRKKSFFPITGHSLLSYHRTVYIWNICQVCIHFIYIFTDTCSLSSSLSFTATGTTYTLNILLQHGTVRSLFLPLQKGTGALVQKQHLHSENISLLHGVKEKFFLQAPQKWLQITRQGLLYFLLYAFLKAFADKEFANLVLLTTSMLLGVTQI